MAYSGGFALLHTPFKRRQQRNTIQKSEAGLEQENVCFCPFSCMTRPCLSPACEVLKRLSCVEFH